jgi:chitin synthase
MQFVLFIDFVGTVSLPAAITFTLYLVIMAILGKPAVISLILLALILGLPAVLIVMTSRKVVYVCWMLLYIISLPVWNFVLPVYAYWHFDDFSWGDTRKVEGEQKEGGHGDKEGEFDSSVFTMKRWHEFERDRRTQYALDHELPAPRFLERPRSDAFRDSTMMLLRRTRQGSIHSNESDWPLASTGIVPAGMVDCSPSPSPSPSSNYYGSSTSRTNISSVNINNKSSKMRYEVQDDLVEEVPLDDMQHHHYHADPPPH